MARAARAFGRATGSPRRARALDFIRATLWRDGRLLATCKDGRAHLNAYLDDYAFLLAALLEMLQAEFRRRATSPGRASSPTRCWSTSRIRARGGFFFTSPRPRAADPPAQARPRQRDAVGQRRRGAGRSQRLAQLTGEPRYPEAARRTLALFWPQLERHPGGFGSLLAALEEQLAPPRTVIVRRRRRRLRAVATSCSTRPTCPTTLSCSAFRRARRACPARSPSPRSRRVNAWVCEGVTCLPPIGLDAERDCATALELPKIASFRRIATPAHRSSP